jgi:hypothetical protein
VDELETPPAWQTVVGLAVTLLPVGLILVPLFLFSDNVHAFEESTAFDRLALARRTFWYSPGASLWSPSTWRLDPNFPLGTAFVFGALPQHDLVAWARLHSAVWAVFSTVVGWRLLCPLTGPIVAGIGAAAFWTVPAFARGAVVSGEEAPFTALLLLALLGLLRPGWRWAVVACLAANATVLWRIDAMAVLPGFAVVAVLAWGWRRGLLWSLASGLTSLLHFAVSGEVNGDWLAFARQAQAVTRSTSIDSSSDTLTEILALIAGGVGGTPALAVAALGILSLLWKGGMTGRAIALLTLWLATVYGAVGWLGVLQIEFLRYLVPLLVLIVAAAPCVVLTGPRRTVVPLTLLLAVGLGVQLHQSAVASTRQAAVARVPDGLEGAAHWLAMCAGGERTLSTSHLAELLVLGPLSLDSTSWLKTRWNSASPPPVADQLAPAELKFVVVVATGPTVQAFREASDPSWRFLWQEYAVTIYGRTSDAEHQRLLGCSRW